MFRLCLSLSRGTSSSLLLPSSSLQSSSLQSSSLPSLLSSPFSSSAVCLRSRNQKRRNQSPPPPSSSSPSSSSPSSVPLSSSTATTSSSTATTSSSSSSSSSSDSSSKKIDKRTLGSRILANPYVMKAMGAVARRPIMFAVGSLLASFIAFNIGIRKFYTATSQASAPFQVQVHLMKQSTEMVEMFGDPENWEFGIPSDDNSSSSRVVSYTVTGETGAQGLVKVNFIDAKPIPRDLDPKEVINRISTLIVQMAKPPREDCGVNETTRHRTYICVVAPPYVWHAARTKEKQRITSESSEKYIEEMTPELTKEKEERKKKILQELDALIKEEEEQEKKQ